MICRNKMKEGFCRCNFAVSVIPLLTSLVSICNPAWIRRPGTFSQGFFRICYEDPPECQALFFTEVSKSLPLLLLVVSLLSNIVSCHMISVRSHSDKKVIKFANVVLSASGSVGLLADVAFSRFHADYSAVQLGCSFIISVMGNAVAALGGAFYANMHRNEKLEKFSSYRNLKA